MILISIIVSLLIERFLQGVETFRPTRWFQNYSGQLHKQFAKYDWMNGATGVIIIIAPLALLTGIVEYMLYDVHAFFSFLFGILILVYCTGPKKLHEEMEKYIHTRNSGDTEGSYWRLDNIIGADLPKNEPELMLLLARSVLVETCKRILAVLFWFAILGPVGAVIYRFACLLRDNTEKQETETEFGAAAYRLQYILNWVPARLTALSYALAGSFVHALDCWRETGPLMTDKRKSMGENEEVISRIGLSSLQLGGAYKDPPERELTLNDISETLKLGMRAVVVWVTSIAIMTLAGWLG